jgi:hypothetical protein
VRIGSVHLTYEKFLQDLNHHLHHEYVHHVSRDKATFSPLMLDVSVPLIPSILTKSARLNIFPIDSPLNT